MSFSRLQELPTRNPSRAFICICVSSCRHTCCTEQPAHTNVNPLAQPTSRGDRNLLLR
jgi:hypothetical protein